MNKIDHYSFKYIIVPYKIYLSATPSYDDNNDDDNNLLNMLTPLTQKTVYEL